MAPLPEVKTSPPDTQTLPPADTGMFTSPRAFKIKTALTWLILLSLVLGLFGKMGLQWDLIEQKLPFLLGLRLSPDGFIQGAALTILITACSMFFCLFLGLITALGRMSGIVLGALSSGIIALSLNYGAYLAETIRSGVLSVPRGQKEAAMALGLSSWTVAVHVTAPQALRIIIPPAGSMFISMLKDSSLVSLMGLWELNFLAQSYGRSTYRYMEMLATAAAIYWMMSIVLELFQSRLERRFGQGYRR